MFPPGASFSRRSLGTNLGTLTIGNGSRTTPLSHASGEWLDD